MERLYPYNSIRLKEELNSLVENQIERLEFSKDEELFNKIKSLNAKQYEKLILHSTHELFYSDVWQHINEEIVLILKKELNN